MTDRHNGYLVILKNPIREDDAGNIIKAIGLIKGVISVKPMINNWESSIALERARRELTSKLFRILEDETVEENE